MSKNEKDSPIAETATPNEDDLLSIAGASEALEVTQRTLRFYEDKGLIKPKRIGSMRVYSKREMGRMRLIQRGKRLGFTIREIGEFLALYEAEHGQESQVRHLLDQVSGRLGELHQQREAIDETIVELEAITQQAQNHLKTH